MRRLGISLGALDELEVGRPVGGIHVVRDAVTAGQRGLEDRVAAAFELGVNLVESSNSPQGSCQTWAALLSGACLRSGKRTALVGC